MRTNVSAICSVRIAVLLSGLQVMIPTLSLHEAVRRLERRFERRLVEVVLVSM